MEKKLEKNPKQTIFSLLTTRKLPVPALKDTLRKLKNRIRAVGSNNKEKMEEFDKALDEFSKNQGIILQSRLLLSAKNTNNWLYDYQLDHDFLKKRDPLICQSSYYTLMNFKFKTCTEAVVKLILSQIFLKNNVVNNNIKELTKLDTYQYFFLFHTCRIPYKNLDELITFEYNQNKHVILLYKGVFWMINVSFDYNVIYQQIEYILMLNVSDKKSTRHIFGKLTGFEDRNNWADFRHKFINFSPKNKIFIDYIEQSLILICIEDKKSTDFISISDFSKYCWFGGDDEEGPNRYFDKVVQYVCFQDGYVAINFDNSALDFSMSFEVIKFIKDICEKGDGLLIDENKDDVKIFNNKYIPTKLVYKELPEMEKLNKDCSLKYLEFHNKFKHQSLFFLEFGKKVIQGTKFTIEAIILFSIQLAYYKYTNKIEPICNISHTRNFQMGSTAYHRATTRESSNFVKIMADYKAPRELKLRLGVEASKILNADLKDAYNGKSVNGHIHGLLSVLKPNEEVPKLYKNELLIKSTIYRIFTRQVDNDSILLSCSPLYSCSLEDSIGLCYIIKENSIQFFVTSVDMDVDKFIDYLVMSLRELKLLNFSKDYSRY